MIIDVKCAQCGDPLKRKQAPSIKTKIHFCNKVCKGLYQKTVKPVSGEWLRESYAVKGMNCTEIAAIVGRDPKTVWEWVRAAGIETRKRGFASMNGFKKGQPSAFTGHKHTEETKNKVRMARMSDGRIPALINGVHWTKALGRRGSNWKGGITPERQALYSSPEWVQCVKDVWKRDDAKCRRCGLDNRNVLRGVIAFHIHHIDSFMIRERRAVLDNLVLLCQHCHRWIHGKKNKKRQFLGYGH